MIPFLPRVAVTEEEGGNPNRTKEKQKARGVKKRALGRPAVYNFHNRMSFVARFRLGVCLQVHLCFMFRKTLVCLCLYCNQNLEQCVAPGSFSVGSQGPAGNQVCHIFNYFFGRIVGGDWQRRS